MISLLLALNVDGDVDWRKRFVIQRPGSRVVSLCGHGGSRCDRRVELSDSRPPLEPQQAACRRG